VLARSINRSGVWASASARRASSIVMRKLLKVRLPQAVVGLIRYPCGAGDQHRRRSPASMVVRWAWGARRGRLFNERTRHGSRPPHSRVR
jgi:hypothetical protein